MVAKRPATVSNRQSVPVSLGDRRGSLGVWQDRIRDPMLTVLLALEICTIFLAVPLAAKATSAVECSSWPRISSDPPSRFLTWLGFASASGSHIFNVSREEEWATRYPSV